jgi:hypothetical protein
MYCSYMFGQILVFAKTNMHYTLLAKRQYYMIEIFLYEHVTYGVWTYNRTRKLFNDIGKFRWRH